MDQSEHQNQKSLAQYLIPQFLKKVTQFILSFSLFSFIFSYSSWNSIFIHTFKFYFSSLPFKLLTHTLDKNYTFLICNAILVFLANTSGLLHLHSWFNPNEQELIKNHENEVLQTERETKQSLLENEVLLENEGSNLIVEDEEQEETSGFVNTGEVREEEKGSLSFMVDNEEQEETSGLVNTEKEPGTCVVENEELESGLGFEEEEENEEEIGQLSREELNKKFEDFIRRVKEGIRIEARGQLIMV